MMNAPLFNELTATYLIAPATLQQTLDDLAVQAGARFFYIFWTRGSGSGARPHSATERTLLAFSTPDAALSFAQRNRLNRDGERPRLRRLSLIQLLYAILREPTIIALYLVIAEPSDTPPGQFPDGLRIERNSLIERLHAHVP